MTPLLIGTACFILLNIFYILLWKQNKIVSVITFFVFLPVWLAGGFATAAIGGIVIVGGLHYLAFFVLAAIAWFYHLALGV